MVFNEEDLQYLHPEKENEVDPNYLIGILLAVGSSTFIGSSFVVKKLSLIRVNKSNSLRAGSGGYGYLKDWLWWAGFFSLGLGELLNLVAYGFAPASVVTPLGALSVFISAVLASKYLQEHLTNYGKIGCVLCIVGSVIIVASAPPEVSTETMLSVSNLEKGPVIVYTIFVVLLSFFLICFVAPKYGNRFVLIYVVLCSQVGSFTVVASKILALSIRGAFLADRVQYEEVVISFIVLIMCVCIQLTYLNKALDIFGTSAVIPIYYVMFTTLVLLFTGILFDEWKRMTSWNVFGTLVGLLIAFVAIFLLHTKETQTGSDPLLKNGDSSRYN